MTNRYQSLGPYRDASGRIAVRDNRKGLTYEVHPDGQILNRRTKKPVAPGGQIAVAVLKAARGPRRKNKSEASPFGGASFVSKKEVN